MGGFGFMSYHRGTQMDHLIELEVVTGEGERRVCSPSSDRQLFDAVRATHGQLAIITRARIPLERAPRKVRMLQAAYGSVESLLSDMERLAREKGAGGGGSVDLVHGFAAQKTAASVMTRMNSTQQMRLDRAAVDAALAGVGGDWVFNLEMSALVLDHDDDPSARRLDLTRLGHLDGCIDEWELSWEEFCFRKPPLILEEQFHGAAPHPELTVFLPFSSEATALMVAEFERLHPIADIGGGPVLLFPLDRTRVTAPYLRLPAPSHGFFLGLLRRAEPPTADRIQGPPTTSGSTAWSSSWAARATCPTPPRRSRLLARPLRRSPGPAVPAEATARPVGRVRRLLWRGGGRRCSSGAADAYHASGRMEPEPVGARPRCARAYARGRAGAYSEQLESE